MAVAGRQTMSQDLVLVGGGHSHAILLRRWGAAPLPGVRLTLISDATRTPYSGMLPGYVAGFYPEEACHIDLLALAEFAGARLMIDRAMGLDLANQRVLCVHHPGISFDILSIDIGSTPTYPQEFAGEYSLPVKPVPQFLKGWQQFLQAIAQAEAQHQVPPHCIGIVGGGVRGGGAGAGDANPAPAIVARSRYDSARIAFVSPFAATVVASQSLGATLSVQDSLRSRHSSAPG